ncbi:MAG TPA: MMPL family transporter [Vicinamibacterales bacterium]|nr:MMPL family transporter [Vicinamibacterales bacterium]
MFQRIVSTIVEVASRRPALVCGALLCVVALSIEGTRRVTFDPDVLSLLPRDGRVIPAFRTYLSRVGSLDELYVVFTAPAGRTIDDYADDIEGWIEALRAAPEIERVDTGRPDRSRDFEWIADRRLWLLDDTRLEKALNRLSPEGLPAAVAESRALLSVPSSDVAELVRYDPAGLFALVRDSLGSEQAGLNLGISGSGYLAADGRSRLVIARPKQPPFDTEFSRTLDARLQAMRANLGRAGATREDDAGDPLPPLQVEFAGGHRIAVETEAVVKRESIANSIGSLALILPLLFVVYRSFWLVGVGALPSGFSLLIVLGALGFAGARLSAAATGASAMLFGLGVDGVVLLYVAHLLTPTERHSPQRSAALGGPSSSMLLGMWTTAATFYGLTFVDFPSLQQLGLLIGHSMLVCGALTLLVVPALLPRPQPGAGARGLTMPRLASWTKRHRYALVAGAAVATVLLGIASMRLQVDPTLDRLRSATSAARLVEDIGRKFGLPGDVYIVVSEGRELEPLLETNERLVSRLRMEMPGLAFEPPTRLLPSAASQARAAERLRVSNLTPARVAAALEREAAAQSFKPGTFDPFTARLPHLLDASARLTYDGYVAHGLSDLIGRFVVHRDGRWMLVTYAFPTAGAQATRLQHIVDAIDPAQTLTGLPLVNRELADRFLPQFLKGLTIGTLMVVGLVVLAFRDWRLSMLALLPTVVGLVWTGGILALAGVRLDLFAIFAVVTFLGIGVDYGIHLVHRYREHGDSERATAELAPVIFVAGAITLLGYGTLVNSSYPPLRSMGVVSAVSVVALAAASVLVLPALLQIGRRA